MSASSPQPATRPAGKPAVVVEDLVKRFGAFTAVDRISFSVPTGEVFGFLGPNGAGKSTTIRMLCGIITPTSGRGTVGGFDILTQSERIKERIGYMSQRFSLYEDLTVQENIEFYGSVYGVPPSRLAERRRWILRMAGLGDRAASLTRELSGGWKQRLALGCALVHDPQILFLDEPTAGVDPVSRRSFWDLIYTVAGQGVTVFVTTHYMDEAEHCDRIGLIYDGKLVALDSPARLKERYRAGTLSGGSAAADRDGRGLRAAGGSLLEVRGQPLMTALDILSRQAAAREVAVFGAALHVVVDDESAVEQVRRALEEGGVTVSGISTILPSLEDVFVALIEQADRTLGED